MKKIIEHQFTIWKEGVKKGYFDTLFLKNKLNIDLNQVKSYKDFLKLPFMYKEEIRNSTPFERTNTSMKDMYGIFSSSGSTGNKTFYVYSMEDKEIHKECSKRILSNVGIDEEDLGAILAPIATSAMAHCMMWQFSAVKASYVVCVLPSPDNILNLVKSLPVTCLATMPNIVYNLSLTPEALEITRKSNVKKLILAGNYLSEHKRKIIEDIWKADCYNFYGLSEIFGPLAGECKYKDGFHYNPDTIMIEIINPDTLQPVSDGELGIAVYTTLWSKGFPLLRYWSDDLVLFEKETCVCKSSFPRFRLRGRKQDCTKTMSGKYVFPVDIEEILMENGCFGEFQIEYCKDTPTYIVQIEKEDNKNVNIDKMVKELSMLFELDCQVSFYPIGSIIFDNGKHFRFRSDSALIPVYTIL